MPDKREANLSPGALSSAEIADRIRECLDDKRAKDIAVMNLIGKSDITDYMIIATGTSNTQVQALSEHTEKTLKGLGVPIFSVTGREKGDWVLVDTPIVMVHIFRQDVRDYYQLERLWDADFTQESVGSGEVIA